MGTLKTAMADDLVLNLLNTDDFAEQVTFTPAGNAASTRTITVTIEDAQSIYRVGPMVHETEQTCVVWAAKDEASDAGGIATPQAGDKIKRSDGREYGWTGETQHESPVMWQLVYKQFTLRAMGQVAGAS